jgi:hypothetical protein
MSRMSELNYEIMEMLEQDVTPYNIASILSIPVDWVYEVVETTQMEEAY